MGRRKKRKKTPPVRPPALGPSLLIPMTPFERRMAELSVSVPPPASHPDFEVLKQRAVRAMESDLAFRKKCQDNCRKVPHWGYMRAVSGSGLVMGNTLRDYFREYAMRIINHGFRSLPLSFNVVESFLRFDPDLCLFDLRPEREHLLAADDYFDWYKSNGMPKDPELLMAAMEEGVVYAYNMSGDTAASRVATGHSALVIAGVSVVRHQHELSCVLVAGERPPNPPDDAVSDKEPIVTAPGKENVVPDPGLGVNDRYLEQLPGFARVILLARFDLRGKKYYVRSVNLDNGNSFSVLTDDVEALRVVQGEGGLSGDKLRNLLETNREGLSRYDVLFSTLASLIYLPIAFVAEIEHVREVEFKTEAFACQAEQKVKEAVKELGAGCRVDSVVIRCLARATRDLADKTEIKPPDMVFDSAGYWKMLMPGEIGQDKDGAPIAGRSWVTRTDNWSASKPQAFLLTRPAPVVTGLDPGIVYIMRSEAHALEVYKIGLTRRTSTERSKELSYATGVPLPFGVLAQWEVGDCGGVESLIHERLAAYRVNERREFFRLPLRTIVAVINSVVEATTPMPK